MSIKQFISKENVELMWEILLDEPLQKSSREEIINCRRIFEDEIKLFYNTYSNSNTNTQNITLIRLNQIFLGKIIQQFKPKNIYTSEDIQKDRSTKFDSALSKKRQEFEDAITLKKPPTPVFEDSKMVDRVPVNEMEALIAQTISQRNFDISNIPVNNNYTNWLKPEETSIKSENQQSNSDAIKYIKIGRENLPSLTTDVINLEDNNKNEKKLSWSNDLDSNENLFPSYQTNQIQPPISIPQNNIFSKLKMKSNNTESNHDDSKYITDSKYINDSKYITEIENLKEKIHTIENKLELILEKLNIQHE